MTTRDRLIRSCLAKNVLRSSCLRSSLETDTHLTGYKKFVNRFNIFQTLADKEIKL